MASFERIGSEVVCEGKHRNRADGPVPVRGRRGGRARDGRPPGRRGRGGPWTASAIFLVRQPREAVGEPALLELPAGKLDARVRTRSRRRSASSPRRSARARGAGSYLTTLLHLARLHRRGVPHLPGRGSYESTPTSGEDERIEIERTAARPISTTRSGSAGTRRRCRPALVSRRLRLTPALAASRDGGRRRPNTLGDGHHRHAPTEARFEHLVLDFLAYLEFERGLSRNTLEAYRSDLLQFGRFLAATRTSRARRPSPPTSPTSSTELAAGRTAPPARLAGHDPPQGRLPALVLPPPAPGGLRDRDPPPPSARPAGAGSCRRC